jgi:FdhE protein
LWAQLILVACRGQTPKLETLGAAARREPDHLTLFQASLHQDNGQLGKIAEALGTDCEALQAVANLLPVPLLQACNRHWSGSVKSDWVDGYCPICGAWPAFAEVRGIERSRYLRCGRCGAEWQMHCLFCPYCGTSDHNELLSLVAENNASNVVIDACKRCLGYVKSFTTLQGSPPAKVMLDDLASVELDVVAVERGYKRPQGTGYSLNVNVAAS